MPVAGAIWVELWVHFKGSKTLNPKLNPGIGLLWKATAVNEQRNASKYSGLSQGCVCVQSLMLIIAGFAGLLVNTVVLRWLLRVAGERRVLCIGALPSTPAQCFK